MNIKDINQLINDVLNNESQLALTTIATEDNKGKIYGRRVRISNDNGEVVHFINVDKTTDDLYVPTLYASYGKNTCCVDFSDENESKEFDTLFKKLQMETKRIFTNKWLNI
jgi:hypothetical protein